MTAKIVSDFLLMGVLLILPTPRQNVVAPDAAHPPQTSGQPSLKETSDWLASHLVGVQAAYSVSEVPLDRKTGKPQEKNKRQTDLEFTITAARVTDCRASIVEQKKMTFDVGRSASGSVTDTTTYQIPLSQIESVWLKPTDHQGTPSTVTQRTYSPASSFYLNLSTSRPVILESTQTVGNRRDGTTYTDSNSDTSAFIAFSIDDAALGNRLVNAFTHAAKLCHTTEKPDLF